MEERRIFPQFIGDCDTLVIIGASVLIVGIYCKISVSAILMNDVNIIKERENYYLFALKKLSQSETSSAPSCEFLVTHLINSRR